jgi:hypothetical protein
MTEFIANGSLVGHFTRATGSMAIWLRKKTSIATIIVGIVSTLRIIGLQPY